MKEQPLTYDSFCLEDDCYKQKNAFFKFSTHSKHIMEKHEVKEIHPMTFFHILKTDNQPKCYSDNDLDSSVEKVQVAIEAAIAEICLFLKENIFESFVSRVQKDAVKWADLSVEDFDKKLRSGSYDYLNILREIRKEGKEKVLKAVQNQVEQQLQDVYKDIHQQKQQIMNLFSSLEAHSHQPENPPESIRNSNIIMEQYHDSIEPYENTLKSKQQSMGIGQSVHRENISQIPPSKQRKLARDTLIKMEAEPQIESSFDFWKNKAQVDKKSFRQNLQIEEDQSSKSDDEGKISASDPHKNKMIEKGAKVRGKKKLRVKAEQIYSVGHQELLVKEIFTAHSAFKKIQILAPELRALHIFDQKFLYKATLNQLFKSYPHIHTLTLNCYVDYKCLSSFPDDKFIQFNRLCFRWDMQRFHKEYFQQVSFPTKQLLDLRYKKTKKTICYSLQPKLKNNSHYILLSKSQPLSFYFAKVTSMEVYAGCLKSLQTHEVTKLQYLKLNGHYELDYEKSHYFDITQADEICQNLLIKNKELTQIFLHNPGHSSNFKSKEIYYPFGRTLREISMLPKLTIFSLVCDEKTAPFAVPASSIKKLIQLESLVIINVDFDLSNEQNRFDHLTLLSSLGKIKHLNLYKCKTINSDVMNNLREQSIVQLETLNLGLTSIQKDCLQTISKMKNLRSLNIEQTKIDGQQLNSMLLMYFSLWNEHHPLRHLNIKTKMFKWKIRAFEIISQLKKQQTEQMRTQTHENISIVNPVSNFLSSGSEIKSIDDMLYDVIRTHQKNSPLLTEFKMAEYEPFRQLFTDEDIQNLQYHAPNLQYLNISNHLDLSSVDLTSFKALKIVCRDKLIEWSGKVNPGVKVIELEEDKPYQKEQNNE